MATTLIEPSFEVPNLERLVLIDGEPATYKSGQFWIPYISNLTHALQARNQFTLWEIFLRRGLNVPEGPILDAGCGDGLFEALAPHLVFPKLRRRQIIGLDLDRGKVKLARELSKLVIQEYARTTKSPEVPDGYSLSYTIADAQDLAVEGRHKDGSHKPGFPYQLAEHGIVQRDFPRIAFVWSNSMFHWVKDPGKKYVALRNLNLCMQQGGVLCMSMSAGGTARDFLEAYLRVFKDLGIYDMVHNEQGFQREKFEEDPIGSRPLGEIVDMMEASGFDIKEALTLRETDNYAHPKKYADHVKVYGYGEFLKSVPHYGESRSETLWRRITEEFLDILRKKGWTEGAPYEYSQFNNYLIAVKKETPPTKAKAKGPDEVRVGSLLNDVYLKGAYSNRLIQHGRPMLNIALEGINEEIEDRKTLVDLDYILMGVFSYASSEWILSDTNPTCRLAYSVLDNQLSIQIDVKTSSSVPVEELFKARVLKRLTQSEVAMSYSSLEKRLVRYEFQIPLLT